ncbi:MULTISPECIES: D-TA family PLP-dependent enzyme [unclassified Roseitalea]|uniref:D-TA family PLP-dependent enzyme n=1 Tax=unclassified Roseitalea TaxID=2639107 RepID=UPI00273F57BC|nr:MULTISPECIES: D-TA family PLP-dependent enzyme [unclassified Roseitalea]
MTDFPSLETPCVLIDLDRVETNLGRAQAYADAHGLALRPHVKTHKLPRFARRQVELGASGVTCQKLGEAEVMADAGLDDILVTYNILGQAKLDRLAALHAMATITVAADNDTVVDGYARRFTDPTRPLRVVVECDTGAGRCGVQSPEAALALARRIDAAPGLHFAGLMTYPPAGKTAEVGHWLTAARDRLVQAGLAPQIVSNGGTPDMYRAHEVSAATEHRPGTYIYSDRMQVGFGHGTLDDCALTVLATVVSRPTPDRAVIDAGSKALAADTCAAPGHGHVVEYPDAVITALSEEHGIVDLTACADRPPIGARLRVVPNHVCVVSNLFDEVHLVRDGRLEDTVPVAARGRLA